MDREYAQSMRSASGSRIFERTCERIEFVNCTAADATRELGT